MVGPNSFRRDRFLEYTDEVIDEKISENLSLVEGYPALFLSETESEGQPAARIGTVSAVQRIGRNIRFEVSFKENMPTLHNDEVSRVGVRLGIEDFEFYRGHWAIKPADLFEILYSGSVSSTPTPTAFNLSFSSSVNPLQVSAMMPFSDQFSAVYDTIRQVSETCGMVCSRADDIWDNDAIIQDVVDLIAVSKVVICDCSNRNPNVFYETGIAHALGRNVILITQNSEDIPFDVQHIRHIRYLNNEEGRQQLAESLEGRIRTLRNR